MGRGARVAPGRLPNAALPNRTCELPRIRLSTSRSGGGRLCRMGPRGGDLAPSVEVAFDGHRSGLEQVHPVRASPPQELRAVAFHDPSLGLIGMLLPQPYPDPPPQVVLQVKERGFGRPIPKIDDPSPGYLSQPPKEEGRGLVRRLFRGDFLHLPPDRCRSLLGRVGVDQSPLASPLTVPLDAEPEEVESLVDVSDLRFLRCQP